LIYKRLFLFLTTFIFIYGFKVFAVLDLILLISLLLCFSSYVFKQQISLKPSIGLLILLTVFSIYSLLISFFSLSEDIEVSGRLIRTTLNTLGGLILVDWYLRFFGGNFLSKLFIDILLSILLHSALMLLMFLDPLLREGIYYVTGAAHIVNMSSPFLHGYRITGLTYGLSTTSVLQAVGVLFIPYALNRFRAMKLVRLSIYLGGVLIVISVFLSGRSGLLILLIFTFLYFINSTLRSLFITQKVSFRMIFAWICIFSFAGAIAYVLDQKSTIFERDQRGGLYYLLENAEEIITVMTDPDESRTVAAMSHMYFIPDDPLILLFGSGYLDRSVLGIKTDVGWIRTLYSLGVIGVLFTIFVIFYMFLSVYLSNGGRDKYGLVLLGLLLILMVLMHFKENFVFARNYWSITCLVYFALLYNSYLFKSHNNGLEIRS
jgi:hypothetical protein